MKSNLNTQFPQHFREFLIELHHYAVEYMIIGGYALGAYGHGRGTNDLDIFINATPENADRMWQACVSYGIDEDSLDTEMFLAPRMTVIGEAPFRIEIIKKLDAVDFQYAYARTKTVQMDELSLRIVGLDDLILLKHAAVKGRSQARDTEDLSFLQKLKAALRKKNR